MKFVLQNRGEKLSDAELAQHLTSLLGEGDVSKALTGNFNAGRFAHDILGFTQ